MENGKCPAYDAGMKEFSAVHLNGRELVYCISSLSPSGMGQDSFEAQGTFQ